MNKIELSDDKIGVFDHEDEYSYLSWSTGMNFQKPLGKGLYYDDEQISEGEDLKYYNLILINEGSKS